MKKVIKGLIITMVLALSISSLTFVSAIDSTYKNGDGFVKIEGDYALKADGSLWKINLFYNEENEKIGDGFIDIDSDKYFYAYTAIKSDGSLWAWGFNSHGQFAEVDIQESDVPVKIMENVKEVSGMVALKNDGSVWAWGGRRFVGVASKANEPVLIYKGAKSISFLDFLVKIVDNNGVLYQIEDIDTLSYEEVQDKKIKIFDKVEYVKNNLYIREDKTLWQTRYSYEDPMRYEIILILKDVIYVDSAECSRCAIQEDGTLWVWGFNDDNIPDKLKGFSSYPQKIMSGVKYASCAIQKVLVVKNDGSLCGLGAVTPKTEYSIPRVIMKGIKNMFDNGWVLDDDNTLWSFDHYLGVTDRIKITDNVKMLTKDGIIEKIDGTKWRCIPAITDSDTIDCVLQPVEDSIVELNNYSHIKNDGTLWKKNRSSESESEEISLEKFDDNVNKIYVSNHLIYYTKSDDSLWVSLNGYNNSTAAEKVQVLSEPLKLMDGIKEATCVDPYIFAVSNVGELLVWRINTMESTPVSTEPKKIMDDVEAFDNELPMPLGVIKKDGSRWSGFLIDDFVQPDDVKENYAQIMSENLVKTHDNIHELQMYNEKLFVKKNGEFWMISKYNSSGMSTYEKVMDNVIYAEAYKSGDAREGIALCADGSLWDVSEKEPKKLLEKVKEAHYQPVYKVFTALQEDNSFYVWGHNAFGECGIDSPEEIISEPYKLLDGVTEFKLGHIKMDVLKKDGTLMSWGLGFPLGGHSSPYVINPLSSGNFDKDTKIQHRNFESVGINEKFDIIVKINDPAHSKDVKVTFNTGAEQILDKSSEGYYVGTVPGFDTAGVISYRITASDGNDKTITSDEYKVEVLKNNMVLFDYMNEEVFVSDSSIIVNGKQLITDVTPVIKEGRTLIPVRALCEAVNADVEWDDGSKTVNISAKNKSISMKIGEKEIMVNKTKQSIDVPAIIVQGRTMLPLRTVGEILGAEIEWNEKDKRIDVSLN